MFVADDVALDLVRRLRPVVATDASPEAFEIVVAGCDCQRAALRLAHRR
jgi:hypothetical protein